MKKSTVALAGILAALSLLLALPAAAQAGNTQTSVQESPVDETASAGIMPDSPLYALDTAFARLSLALTFNKAAKAEKGIGIAQERLLEVKAMAEKGKLDAAAKAENEYEHSLETATSAAEEIESGNDPAAAIGALHRISLLQNQTESHYEKMTRIKDKILENKNATMNEQQLAHLRDVFGKIEEKARNMEIKLDLKNDMVKSKEKALANLTTEQLTALDEQIKEKTGLAKGRQERAQNQIERARAALKKAKEKTDETEARGIDVSEIKDMLDDAEEQADLLNASDTDNKSGQYHAKDLENLGREVSSIATSLGEARKKGNFSDQLNKLKETIEERRTNRSQKPDEPEEASERSKDASRRGEPREEGRKAERLKKTADVAEPKQIRKPQAQAAPVRQSTDDEPSSRQKGASENEQPKPARTIQQVSPVQKEEDEEDDD